MRRGPGRTWPQHGQFGDLGVELFDRLRGGGLVDQVVLEGLGLLGGVLVIVQRVQVDLDVGGRAARCR